jgi:hypothetical protein
MFLDIREIESKDSVRRGAEFGSYLRLQKLSHSQLNNLDSGSMASFKEIFLCGKQRYADTEEARGR